MLRLIPMLLGALVTGALSACVVSDGMGDDRAPVLRDGDGEEDSFESGPLRRKEISTVTIWTRGSRQS